MTPIAGRFLLNLRGRVDDPEGRGSKHRATDWVEAGIVSARLGLWDKASDQWQRAVQLDPWNTDALNNLAVAHDLEGDLALAASEYEQALALERMNVYIRYNYELLRCVCPQKPRDEHRNTATGSKLCH